MSENEYGEENEVYDKEPHTVWICPQRLSKTSEKFLHYLKMKETPSMPQYPKAIWITLLAILYLSGIIMANHQIDTPRCWKTKLKVSNCQLCVQKKAIRTSQDIYIADAVNMVSQFMHCPSEDHIDAVIRILQYLKSSLEKRLMFSKNDHLRVEGYTDVNWAENTSDKKSTSWYFMFVGGNLVMWRSKKQNVVALLSAEAKFRGMTKKLLTEIGFAPNLEMDLFYDNKDAIAISHNPDQHDQTKHIEIDRHFIKHNLETKIVRFIKSESQLVDVLTKAVYSKLFHNSLDKVGIGDLYALT
ncbi:cysteine-rich RLK (RECEPTOR-like protein kinase) 8 [Abeliophyllum distichum]|uniref:Cysteine-rich RLK (RECEPTOR-like protein kinase) 8 n=1 Tax=Abeliophyllum distichum TaxID=126358 RepID=A0ABD1UMI8_9LAMI